MDADELIEWLLGGDVAIQFQTKRDLMSQNDIQLQKRISKEGWGKEFLSRRNENVHWGRQYYQPKWISSHYTLLDLRNLNLAPDNSTVKETIDLIFDTCIANDGGIQLGPSTSVHSDVCVNGMFLNFASYFRTDEKKISSIVDSILVEKMPDGGFNCCSTRSGATHSSLHSTLSVLEGITEYEKNGYQYRLDELKLVKASSIEFILQHQLFLSDRTGEIIRKDFLKLTYPDRWKYNILRALDYFQYEGVKWDPRMQPAIDVLFKKRNKNGTWNVQAKHAGQVHFEMEKAGKPSRWNTLRALRVLKQFKIEQ